MFPGPCAADVQQEVFALAHAREGARANSEALAAVVAGDLTSGLLFTEGGVSGADGTPVPILRPLTMEPAAPWPLEKHLPLWPLGACEASHRDLGDKTGLTHNSYVHRKGGDFPIKPHQHGTHPIVLAVRLFLKQDHCWRTDGHEAHAREAEFRFESPFREGREVRLPSRAESRCPSFRLWLGEGLLPLRAPSRCGGGAGGAESGREKKPSRALQAQQGAALNASLH
ncbi:unnamed protein product [Rangifer tarandus platyrhynchus]|uniref:Uncharacterized protein n=2 Tax=Rangifer tarandus platyrhynchus TaxID=3082113 RepID=A0ABN8ZLK8_RANTA|nr:unnamed protein product [Rangifer tarandus platyrhynchus]CAI9708343.1 unnamed protein product [Rangifer tarandus platyrhynchus]